MTESELEIHWEFTEAEYAAYEALRTRQQRAWKRSFWSSLTTQVVFGVAVSGLVSLLAVASGASSSQAGGIIAVLAFAAFYAGLWTPSIGDWVSRASRFALFKTYIGDYRLSITETGIWVSNDSGTRQLRAVFVHRFGNGLEYAAGILAEVRRIIRIVGGAAAFADARTAGPDH
jgi:hypothetical protein